VKPWTLNYLAWVKQEVHFEQLAQETTLLDYLHEVEHSEARIARLDPMTGESCVLSSMAHIRIAEGAYPAGWVPAVDEWVL
jgi:hypothetical protein